MVTNWSKMVVRAQVDQTKQRKLNFEYWNPRQMHTLCTCSYSYSRTTFLVATQCLFHAPTIGDHAQLLPEDAIILQFCVPLAMWHNGIFVYCKSPCGFLSHTGWVKNVVYLTASCDRFHAWGGRRLLNPEHLVLLLAGSISHTSIQYMDFVEIFSVSLDLCTVYFTFLILVGVELSLCIVVTVVTLS